MTKKKESTAIAEKQAKRSLQASPSFQTLPPEEQRSIHRTLSSAYEAALLNQSKLDLIQGLESFHDDGLAADFLNQLAFQKFVSDLIKGVFDAVVSASIKQMDQYRELMKAATASLSEFANEISDKTAREYLNAPSKNGDDHDQWRRRKTKHSSSELRAAKLILAAEQRRLLRQVVLIGIARLLVDKSIAQSKIFLGINAARDASSPRLREKIIRALFGRELTRGVSRKARGSDSTGRTRGGSAGELSGGQWVMRFPGSKDVIDLEPAFRNNVSRFLAALKAAEASLTITSTFRPSERAYLMHWSWKIAKGQETGENIPPKLGVDIIWWHGNPEATKDAAQQMVDGYGIGRLGVAPALNSRHTERKAIDMRIFWRKTLTIKKADGRLATINTLPRDGTNAQLIGVGKTYNVIHFLNVLKDAPHWSTDGR